MCKDNYLSKWKFFVENWFTHVTIILLRFDHVLSLASGVDPQELGPVDWLGLSRLGSPNTTPRSPDDREDADIFKTEAPGKPEAHGQAGKKSTSHKSTNDATFGEQEDLADGWLSAATSPKKTTKSLAPSADAQKGDTRKAADDWLGLKPSSADKTDEKDSAADYLGLGSDIDPDTLT